MSKKPLRQIIKEELGRIIKEGDVNMDDLIASGYGSREWRDKMVATNLDEVEKSVLLLVELIAHNEKIKKALKEKRYEEALRLLKVYNKALNKTMSLIGRHSGMLAELIDDHEEPGDEWY